MGIYGPVDVQPGLLDWARENIVLPCIHELAKRGMPFIGCLYPGLMLTKAGPMVLEFNARMGDPETQWYMRMLQDDVDFYEVTLACAEGNLARLGKDPLRWYGQRCAVITLAAAGYPEKPEKGDRIVGWQNYLDPNGKTVVFHGGTSWENGELVTSGGRVLSVSTMLDTGEPVSNAYEPMRRGLVFSGCHYREDIGQN